MDPSQNPMVKPPRQFGLLGGPMEPFPSAYGEGAAPGPGLATDESAGDDAGGAEPAADEPDPLGGQDPKQVLAEVTQELLADDPPIISPDSLLLSDDEEIKKVAWTRIVQSCAFRSSFEARWTTAWVDWMLYIQGVAKGWESKVKIPLVYQQVSSALPSFVAAIFDAGPLFDVQSRKPEHEKQARAVRDMVEHFLRVQMSAEEEAEEWVTYAVLLGTGVMRTSWLRVEGIAQEQEDVQVPMPGGETTSAGTRTKNVFGAVIENRPVMEAVDLWNWFPAPYLSGNCETPWCFERVETTAGNVERDAKAGVFGKDGVAGVAMWFESKPWNQSNESSPWATANSRASAWGKTGMTSPYAGPQQSESDSDYRNSLVVYWVMSASDYRIFISGDGSKVIGKTPNPYKHGKVPYVVYHFQKIPKSPFGRGVGDIVADLQRQIDFNYNKGNDAAQLAINKPMTLKGAGNAGVTVVWQPGVIVRLRDVDDMKPLEVKNPMAEVSQMNAELSSHADKATGLNDLSRGDAQPGVNTATEFAGVQGQFRMRMSGHARHLKSAMSRLGRQIISMIQQFIDAETAIRVIGEDGLDWQTVKPDELVGEFDVFSTANFSKSNPALVRNDLVALAPIVLTNPMVNQPEFLKRLFMGFEFDHPERLIVKPPPPERDPLLEEMALDLGIPVEPSPMEVMTGGVTAHLQTHMSRYAAKMADPSVTPEAKKVSLAHIEKTMEMYQQAGAMMAQQQGAGQAGPPGEGGPPKPGQSKKPAGGSPERRDATKNGQAQGSDGPPGRSPGPAAPPNKPQGGGPPRE